VFSFRHFSLSRNVSIFVSEIGEGDGDSPSLAVVRRHTGDTPSLCGYEMESSLSVAETTILCLSVDLLESEGKCIVVLFNHACLD